MLLRADPERQKAELQYVRDMHLNTVRLEGKTRRRQLPATFATGRASWLLAGWCCCDHWERWRDWKSEDFVVSAESLKDQIRRLRSHARPVRLAERQRQPPPVEKVEKTYIQILKEYNWPNPYQSSATGKPTARERRDRRSR